MKNKENCGYDLTIAVVAALAVIYQGCYFPLQYVFLLIALSGLVLYKKIHHMDLRYAKLILLSTALLCIFYIVSTLFASADLYMSIIETGKPFIFLFGMIAVLQIKNENIFLNGIIYGALAVSILGILSYLGMAANQDWVLKSNGLVRLQSTLQYANVAAVVLAIGYLLSWHQFTGNSKSATWKSALIQQLLLTAFCLTFSRGMFFIWLMVMLVWIYILKMMHWIPVFVYQLLCAVVSAFVMNHFVIDEQYVKATVVLLISLIASYGSVILSPAGKKSSSKVLNSFMYLSKRNILVVVLSLAAVLGISAYALWKSGYVLRSGTWIDRWIQITDGLSAFVEHPFSGVGPDNWKLLQFTYQTAQNYVHYVHSFPVQILLDAGAFAILSFISVIFFFYKGAYNNFKQGRKTECITAMAGVSMILLHSCMDVDLSFPAVWLIFAGFIALGIRPSMEGAALQKIGFSIKTATGIMLLMSIYIVIELVGMQSIKQMYNQGKYAEALLYLGYMQSYCYLDSDLYYTQALIEDKYNHDTRKADALLVKASQLSPYETKYLQYRIAAAYTQKSYKKMGELADELIRIRPLAEESYQTKAMALYKMFEAGQIGQEQLKELGRELFAQIDRGNGRMNKLAGYLPHQKTIRLGEELEKVFK